MSAHYPQVRVKTASGYTRIREGLSLTFYLPPRHPEYAEDVLRALELYSQYTGPGGVRSSPQWTQFAVMHGVSQLFHLIESVLAAVLVLKSR